MDRSRFNIIQLIMAEENGQDLVEYSLILGFLVLVAAVALPRIGAFCVSVFTALGIAYYNAGS